MRTFIIFLGLFIATASMMAVENLNRLFADVVEIELFEWNLDTGRVVITQIEFPEIGRKRNQATLTVTTEIAFDEKRERIEQTKKEVSGDDFQEITNMLLNHELIEELSKLERTRFDMSSVRKSLTITSSKGLAISFPLYWWFKASDDQDLLLDGKNKFASSGKFPPPPPPPSQSDLVENTKLRQVADRIEALSGFTY
jgi:hypothetical protein